MISMITKILAFYQRPAHTRAHTHTRTHPFNGPFSGTTRVSQYQKGKTSLDFTEARDSEWQWHQLARVQVCTSLQTDNHASTPPLSETSIYHKYYNMLLTSSQNGLPSNGNLSSISQATTLPSAGRASAIDIALYPV